MIKLIGDGKEIINVHVGTKRDFENIVCLQDGSLSVHQSMRIYSSVLSVCGVKGTFHLVIVLSIRGPC